MKWRVMIELAGAEGTVPLHEVSAGGSTAAEAGVTTTPILDWFHIGMRLQHLKQIAAASPKMARSAPVSGIDLIGLPMQTKPLLKRHDPPNV